MSESDSSDVRSRRVLENDYRIPTYTWRYGAIKFFVCTYPSKPSYVFGT